MAKLAPLIGIISTLWLLWFFKPTEPLFWAYINIPLYQFLISLYAAYFVTTNGLSNSVIWWIGAMVFSAVIHALLFRFVLKG